MIILCKDHVGSPIIVTMPCTPSIANKRNFINNTTTTLISLILLLYCHYYYSRRIMGQNFGPRPGLIWAPSLAKGFDRHAPE